MLAVLPSMWNRYHGWCRCTLGSRSAAGAEVVIDGEASSPLAWHLVEAELGKACELAGAASVVVDRRPGDGPRQQRIQLAWSSDAVATNRG